MPRVVWLNCTAELRSAARDWDDLWTRSKVTTPMARAELIAQWVEQFAPSAEFQAIVVEHDGRWVAALPLVGIGLCRLLSSGTLPVNTWAFGGRLLVDMQSDVASTLDVMVLAMRELPWQMLWLDEVRLDSAEWHALRDALTRAEMVTSAHQRYEVGMLELDNNWDAYEGRLSRNHRQKMRKAARCFSQTSGNLFKTYSTLDPLETEFLLRRAFEVEDRSWKGTNNSSVFKRGMFPYYARQARQLAAWGHFMLHSLEVNGSMIAFNYGMMAKCVYHSCKIGYDPNYADFRPGYLLWYRVIEHFTRNTDCHSFDFQGELCEAASCWQPNKYIIGELLIAPRRVLGKLTVRFHRDWWPNIRKLKLRLKS